MVGGITGRIYLNNTSYDAYYSTCGWGYGYCQQFGDFHMAATDVRNSGEVCGITDVGELIGYFESDGYSTINGYTIAGTITQNGEVLEGDYSIGSNKNLTASDRVFPEVEE